MAETSKVEQKSTFEITVNGVLIKVDVEKLRVERVLEIAKEYGAMPGKPEDYQLQGDKGLYKPDDWVNFEEDKEFITIPQGPTDIAQGMECLIVQTA